jgi:transposase, IS5 family
MRQERITQASLFDIFATHEIGRELKRISQWLDQHRSLLRLVSNVLGGSRAGPWPFKSNS